VIVLARFEAGTHTPSNADLARLLTAFDEAGVEFTDGDEPGVKLKKRANE
jgi:hypothetical protein